MTFHCQVYDSFEQVDATEWTRAVSDDATFAVDPRVLRLQEQTLAQQCRSWFVIVRDNDQNPVAAAALCLFQVDLCETSGSILRRVAQATRKFWPRFFRMKVLFCGLPVPAGHHQLRIRAGVPTAPVLAALNECIEGIARRERARLIVFKEIGAEEHGVLRALDDLDYVRGSFPAMHEFPTHFKSFDEYYDALNSRHRKIVKRAKAKFREAGLVCRHITDPGQIERAFTPGVHELYLNIWRRADYRLEQLPLEFFRRIPELFPRESALTAIYDGSRIVAFTLSVMDRDGVYHNLYSGLDYAINEKAALYFNLFYHDLDYAFSLHPHRIELGQTSDEFKARLGSLTRPLYFCVRATNRLLHWVLKRFHGRIFPPIPALAEQHVFKEIKPAAIAAATKAEPVPAALEDSDWKPSRPGAQRKGRGRIRTDE